MSPVYVQLPDGEQSFYAQVPDGVRNFYIQIPVAVVAELNLWGDFTAFNSNFDGSYELGMLFIVTENADAIGARVFVKNNANTSATFTATLWRHSDGAALATVVISNPGTDDTWAEGDFASPVALTANVEYMISYNFGSGTNAYERPTPVLTNGILEAKGTATDDNHYGWWGNSNNKPTNLADAGSPPYSGYGVDVIVSP